MGRVVARRISLKAGGRGTPTVSTGRKAAVLDATWRAPRTPPGSESGACLQRGSAGTGASHLSPGTGGRSGEPADARTLAWPRGASTEPRAGNGDRARREPARDRAARDTRSVPRGAGWQSERRLVAGKVGKRGPSDPRAGRRRRASRGAGPPDGRDPERTHRHTNTPAPCGASRPRSRAGVDGPRTSPRRRRSARGRPSHAPVECAGHRGGDGANVCRAPRRPPARLARASGQGTLPGGARRAGLDRDGRRGPAPDRHAGVRGHACLPGGSDAAGSARRAGRRRLLRGRSARPACP